jgi:hypothetical protein
MTVTLSYTSHLEEFIFGNALSGRYHFGRELIRAVLCLLEERDCKRQGQAGMVAPAHPELTEQRPCVQTNINSKRRTTTGAWLHYSNISFAPGVVNGRRLA